MFDKAKAAWRAKKIQDELRKMEFEGSELGGKVRVVVNGEQKVQHIEIADELMNVTEKASVERFLKQAVTAAISKSQQAAANKMKSVAKELGITGL